MSSEHFTLSCARCGAAFAEEAPEGSVCENCASLEADESAATLEAEAVSVDESVPSQVTQHNEVLGDYEILGKLGQGGMGAVYRARQISLDRVVALKVLPSHLEEDETFVARFKREAAVAAGLNHPNLVHVYSSGVADGSHFIAMELVEGENLRQRMKRGDVPMAESVRICLEVARGLQFAWQHAQLIHRDIKPSNLYLSTTGEVKVGDLGLAKSLLSQTTAVTHTGTAIGTPHYISPEQARGERNIDLRADIYSLGCTLYELLTGATPYFGSDPLSVMNMHVNSPPPAIMKVLPQCPIPLGRLVNRMLKKNKLERPQSYEELIAALEQVEAQLALGQAGPSALVSAWKDVGAAEQHGIVARGPASVPVAKSPTVTALGPTRKSKTGLWLSLAAAVIVLGFGAYQMWEPNLDAARARPVAAASPSPAPEVPPSARLTAPPGGFVQLPPAIAARAVPLWDKPEKLPSDGQRILWEDGAVRLTGGNVTGATPSRDAILRAAVRADAVGFTLALRRVGEDKCRLLVSFQERQVSFFSRASGGANRQWPLPREFQPEEWLHLELRIVGDLCAVFAEGQMLGSVRTSALPGEGKPMLSANPSGTFRDAAYIPLDGVPAADLRDLENASTSTTQPVTTGHSTATAGPAPPADALSFQGHRYRFVAGPLESLAWPDARLQAEALGGHLATVNSAQEASWIQQTFSASVPDGFRMYLGGFQPAENEAWQWVTGEPFQFTYWLPGEPSGTRDDPSGTWPFCLQFKFTRGKYGYDDATQKFKSKVAGFLVEWETPAPAPSTAKSGSPEPWRDQLARLRSEGGGRWKDSHVEDDGKLVRYSSDFGAVLTKDAPARNSAIRLQWSYAGNGWVELKIRGARATAYQPLVSYAVKVSPTGVALAIREFQGVPSTVLQQTSLPSDFQQDAGHTLELRATDDLLTVRLDGREIIAVRDRTLVEPGLAAFTLPKGATLLAVETLSLDTPAQASATPATATKDATFTNSLGMKFVPVPITGGPTDKQRVLFSVWETRVQDWEVFVKETNRPEPARPPWNREPLQPITCAPWDGVVEFCAWLTARERKAGRLGSGECYRLPTDHEWSCAAGIGSQEDAAASPLQKSAKIPDVYIWGNIWPPPPGSGNFAGEELRETIEAHKILFLTTFISGFADGFERVAPVGSFQPNPLGLFDLAGNVSEYCSDAGSDAERRIARGASWRSAKNAGLSSYRGENKRSDPVDANGFRVVLSPVP